MRSDCSLNSSSGTTTVHREIQLFIVILIFLVVDVSHIQRIIGCQPEKYTVANPARGLLNRGKK